MTKLIIEKDDPTIFPRFYNAGLIEEYAQARGYHTINVSRISIRQDIENFVKEKSESIDLVRDLLNSKAIDYRESNTIEGVNNREFIVSSNTDCDTTIATTDTTVFREIRRDRIKIGKIKVSNGVPFLVNTQNGYSYKLVEPQLFNTILLINPNLNHIHQYEKLFKNPDYNFIIGESGKTHEFDYAYKIEQIEYLYRRLGDSVIPYSAIRGNNYACLLVQNNLRRYK